MREPGNRGRPGRLKDRKRHGTGDNDEKSENGTQIFQWEVSTGKTGLHFQEFRLFRKISSGTNQNVVFHLHPNQNFRKFLVNDKCSEKTKIKNDSSPYGELGVPVLKCEISRFPTTLLSNFRWGNSSCLPHPQP